MARTTLTKTTPPGAFPTLPPAADSLDVVFTAADVANKNQFKLETGDIVLAWNTHATTTYTVTLTSIADDKNRQGDVTAYSLAAGDVMVFGPLQQKGWRQTDGNMYLEASNAAVKFAILRAV
jgi:hypothetical protein